MQLYDLIAKLKTIEEDTASIGGTTVQDPRNPDMVTWTDLVQKGMSNQMIQAKYPGLDPKQGLVSIWRLQQQVNKTYPDIKFRRADGSPGFDGRNGPDTIAQFEKALKYEEMKKQQAGNNAAAQAPDNYNSGYNLVDNLKKWVHTNVIAPITGASDAYNDSSRRVPQPQTANNSPMESVHSLAEKMRRLDEGLEIMPIMPGHAESQPDNVSMSINVNGQGEGGIRSIMNILRDIEGNDSHGEPSHEHDPKEPLIGDMVKDMNDDIENDTGEESPLSDAPEEEVEEGNENDDGETWANSAHGDAGHHVHGVDAITFSGDDMNSKGKISPVSRAPGTNSLREPSNFDESLVRRLQEHYEQIKNN